MQKINTVGVNRVERLLHSQEGTTSTSLRKKNKNNNVKAMQRGKCIDDFNPKRITLNLHYCER